MKSNIPDPAPDPAAAAGTDEALRHYKRHLAESLSQPPGLTVNDLATLPGVAQVAIFTGKGTGLSICIHGVSLRAVIKALTAIADKGGA